MFKRFILYFSLLVVFISVYFAYTSVSFTNKILDYMATREAVRLVSVTLERGNILDERVLARLRKLLGGEVFIYNKAGDLLATTYQGDVPSPLQKLSPSEIERLQKGPLVKKVELDRETYRYVLFEARINPDISSFFGLLLPTAFEKKVRNELTVGLIYTAFSGLVFMLVVSWFLSRSITRPLEDLVQVAKQLGRGQLTIKIPAKGPPEIQTLIAALNEMTEKLNKYQQRLIETERLATAAQLAASVAHEIKNPLTSLRLAAELLCALLKDQPDLAKRAEVILREASRLEKIVRNMLERTKKLDLLLKETDLNQLTKEVIESATYQIEAREQKISLELAREELKVRVDPEKIKQVIWNLLSNASDVTPRGGLIKVSTGVIDKDQATVIIEDQGPGVPEEKIKELFKPFYTTKPGGTGLGLAISRQIVLLHGGELRLENRKEGGAKASLILPRWPLQVESESSASLPEPSPPKEGIPQ